MIHFSTFYILLLFFAKFLKRDQFTQNKKENIFRLILVIFFSILISSLLLFTIHVRFSTREGVCRFYISIRWSDLIIMLFFRIWIQNTKYSDPDNKFCYLVMKVDSESSRVSQLLYATQIYLTNNGFSSSHTYKSMLICPNHNRR